MAQLSYTWVQGDSLANVAAKFGITVGELTALNGTNLSKYRAGTIVKLPATAKSTTASQTTSTSQVFLPYPTSNLQPGMTGSVVKQLQQYLVNQGYMTQAQMNTGPGIYGPQTTAAVKALQEKLGVDNTTGPGYWGPRTIAAVQQKVPSTQQLEEKVTEEKKFPPAGTPMGQTSGGIPLYATGTGEVTTKSATASTTTEITASSTASTIQTASTATTILPINEEDERQKAMEEAQTYYGYTIPKESAQFLYPQAETEITTQAATLEKRAIEDYETSLAQMQRDKQSLSQDYQNYLQDIETGKTRAGTDYQKDQEKRLEQRRMELEANEIKTKQSLEALHRGWISRGGLYAGPRFESGAEASRLAELSRQQYLSGSEYGIGQAKTAYERAMEDYMNKQTRAGQAYMPAAAGLEAQEAQLAVSKQRTVGDIAQARIKDIRSLQETYQKAIASRMAMTLGSKYA